MDTPSFQSATVLNSFSTLPQPSQSRLHRVLNHFPETYTFQPQGPNTLLSNVSSLFAASTAATTTFGISDKTLDSLKSQPIQTALPETIKTKRSKDLPFTSFSLLTSDKHAIRKEQLDHGIDVDALNQLLDAFCLEERHAIKQLLATHPIFRTMSYVHLTIPKTRELVLEQVKTFGKSPAFTFSDILTNPLRWISAVEILYMHGCNVATKAGVNFGLFGGSVVNLGTKTHHDKYIPAISDASVIGCFALTELNHGSNARGIETTAEYDSKTQEFILHTPNEGAQKIYIGGLADHANHSVIFAQLAIGGKDRGVHAFVTRIRDANNQLLPGIRVKDCGAKMGLNGVDNGRMWLDHFRVSRDALLNKYADVTPKGEYLSDIKSDSKRFTTMIGSLVYGRIVVGQGGLHMAKVGLAIAIKYASTRKQFGPPHEEEITLLEYTSHQRRLLPLVAKTYALQFGMNKVKSTAADIVSPSLSAEAKEELGKELHILAAGLKPICTWHKTKVLQIARECCGGMGFLAVNRIGSLKTDSDVDVTWEGDNTVLLQQVSAALIHEFRLGFKQGKLLGLFNYATQQLTLEIRDKNPFTARARSSRDLQDLEFFSHAFEYRETRLLRSLIRRLGKNRKEKKLDPFTAWNNCLDVVGELANAHVERQCLEAFITEIANIKQLEHSTVPANITAIEKLQREKKISLLPILKSLCALYALGTIQDNMGFYMVCEYFTPVKAKAIWEQINKLSYLLSIKSTAIGLVDAFGIPDGLINAPIAGDWLKEYSYPNIPGEMY